MIKNKTILTASIAVSIMAVAWSIATTVVCIEKTREVQSLNDLYTYYKDRYHACLQGELPFRDINSNK